MVPFNYDFLNDLEDEALQMTGNWEDPVDVINGRCRRRCWKPSGRIRVMERERNANRRWLAVENVKVRARRWFTIRKDYTDRNGNYSIGAFRRGVNYSVAFETPYAKISNWIGWNTSHNGPKRRGAWNMDFGWHSKSWVRATLINAAVEYRVQYRRTGIQNPYPLSYWAGGEAVNKLNIRAAFKEGTGDMFVIRANRIKVFTKNPDDGSNYDTPDFTVLPFMNWPTSPIGNCTDGT